MAEALATLARVPHDLYAPSSSASRPVLRRSTSVSAAFFSTTSLARARSFSAMMRSFSAVMRSFSAMMRSFSAMMLSFSVIMRFCWMMVLACLAMVLSGLASSAGS
jgi:hypothetical protein